MSDTNDFTKLKGIPAGITDDTKTLQSFAFSFNLKGYPLGVFEVPVVPDWVEPYLRVGLGFGQSQPLSDPSRSRC